jgi:hypothetical protein
VLGLSQYAAAGPVATPTGFRPTAVHTPTRTPVMSPPPTITPTPEVYLCAAGENDGEACFFIADDFDCPGGACVFAPGVCQGSNPVAFCINNDECPGGADCVPTQQICAIGDNKGVPCLANAQCGFGALCLSTGFFCDGGEFDLFACVDTDDCIDFAGDPNNTVGAVCRPPDLSVCSAGASDGALCDEHRECGNGACVFTSRLCDGGGEEIDGFSCDNDTDCSGFPCVPTQRICLDVDPGQRFPCLRNEHCASGTCASTGLFCDGGAFEPPDSLPFPIPCQDSADCVVPTPSASGSCEMPVRETTVCSGGGRSGGACTETEECPDGICVNTQAICDGGNSELNFCNSPADCPGGTCTVSFHVCDGGDLQGFSCLRDEQCGAQSAEDCVSDGGSRPCCVASGRVCNGGVFDGLGCIVDANCNCDPLDDACLEIADLPGACEGLTPRPCSLQAPCIFLGSFDEQVFAPSGAAAPASADYLLSAVPAEVAGLVVVLRTTSGDADLYVGRTLTNDLDLYEFTSELTGEIDDVVRVDPLTTPAFASFVEGLTDVAILVVAFDGYPLYRVTAAYLGTGEPGDADCSRVVDERDRTGTANVLFDPAAGIAVEPSFSRCIGTDANGDGRESAADLVGIARRVAANG